MNREEILNLNGYKQTLLVVGSCLMVLLWSSMILTNIDLFDSLDKDSKIYISLGVIVFILFLPFAFGESSLFIVHYVVCECFFVFFIFAVFDNAFLVLFGVPVYFSIRFYFLIRNDPEYRDLSDKKREIKRLKKDIDRLKR